MLLLRDKGSEITAWFIVLLVVIIITGLVFSERKLWQLQWHNFAREAGLKYELCKSGKATILQWPKITGSYQGLYLEMERFTLGSRRRKQFFTSITCSLPHVLPEKLVLTPMNWLTSSKMIDARYRDLGVVRLDDALFDDRLRIKSSHKGFAFSIFSSGAIRLNLRELSQQTPDIEIVIDGRELYYHERSTIMDQAYFLGLLHLLSEVVSAASNFGDRTAKS